MKRLILLILPVLLVLGCSEDKDKDKGKDKKDVPTDCLMQEGPSFASSSSMCIPNAKGTVHTKEFLFRSGQAWLIKRDNTEIMQIILWSKGFENPCAQPTWGVSELAVEMAFPYAPGEYTVNPADENHAVYFASTDGDMTNYTIANSGKVSFRFDISPDIVSGSVQATSDKDRVSGMFGVPFCGERK